MLMFIPILKYTQHSKLAQYTIKMRHKYSFCVVNMFLAILQIDNLQKNCNTAITFFYISYVTRIYKFLHMGQYTRYTFIH
jgi:hypothetical protein